MKLRKLLTSVSKGLVVSLLLAGSANAATIKVATWNIAWLGSHHYNKRTDAHYQELKAYAKQLDADVIALQEVENAQWAAKVLGDEYDYYFTQGDWVQQVGVAVRKSAGLSAKMDEYEELDVGRVRKGLDITLTRNGRSLRLLAVHLKSGCFDFPLDKRSIKRIANINKNGPKTQKSCKILKRQIPILEQWIDDRAKEDIPFMVLGDFNRRFLQEELQKYTDDNGLWPAIDDEGPEDLWAVTMTHPVKCWDGYYKDFIDHIVFDPRAKSLMKKGSFQEMVYPKKFSKEYSRTVSDHCAIAVEMKLGD